MKAPANITPPAEGDSLQGRFAPVAVGVGAGAGKASDSGGATSAVTPQGGASVAAPPTANRFAIGELPLGGGSSSFIYVDTQAALSQALAELRAAEALAVDTEFMRVRTYYPIPALVQVFDGRQVYLLDPVALPGLPGLAALLLDAGIVKVLHAGGEDMEVFQRLFDATPVNFFDTQIGAAALNAGFGLGLSALAEQCLGQTLPKDEARSDWLQRPLTASQLRYATLDVSCLLQIYERQRQALAGSPKLGWVLDESARLAKELPSLIPAEELYRRVKGYANLDGQQLSVLRSLCAWRERWARRKDLPRRWLAEDSTLYQIAKSRLSNIRSLQEQSGLSAKQMKKWGPELMKRIEKAWVLGPADWPPEANHAGLRATDAMMKRLRQLVADKAQELDAAPELLASKRHLEALLRSATEDDPQPAPELLAGWRRRVIGEDLLAAAREAS